MKKTKKGALYIVAALLGALFVLSCLVGFAACGGGSNDSDGDTPTVTSVSLNQSTLAIEYGSSTSSTLTATVMMSSGTYSGSYTWNSTDTNEEVVKVVADGATATVTGVKCGTANVTVTVDGGKTATCTVTVFEDHTAAEAGRVSAVNGDNKSDFTVAVEGGNTVVFDGSDVKTAYDASAKTYTLSGTSAPLGDDELKALQMDNDGDKHNGCEYIAFKVVANAGETVKITNYNGSEPTEGKAWTMYGEGVTGTSTTDGAFVLDTTDHIEGAFSMVLEVTYAGGDVETYTIVLGDIHDCVTQGHELVGTYESGTTSWTYACSVCSNTIDLASNTDQIASLTLKATDYASLSAAGEWSSDQLTDVTPVIDVATAINMTGDVDLKNCAKDMILNADITVTSGWTLNIYTDMTLDLNGQSISVTDTTNGYDYYVVQVGSSSAYGDLTVCDGSVEGTGKISSVGAYVIGVIGIANVEGKTSVFTLESGTIESTYSAGDSDVKGYVIRTQADSSPNNYGAEVINIEGGTVKSTGSSGYGVQLNNGTLNVSGGTISGYYGVSLFGLKSSYKSVTVNVTGGTIEGTAFGISTNGTSDYGMEVINVSGGTVKGDLVGIFFTNGSLTVSGGEISGATGIEIKAGSATISGGKISTTVTDGSKSVTNNSNGASSSGYSIAVVSLEAYQDISSVAISGCEPAGPIYVDASVDQKVTIADELRDLVEDAYGEDD